MVWLATAPAMVSGCNGARVLKPLLVSSNTAPALFAPPSAAVPNRLPLVSASSAAMGLEPFVPVKLSSTMGVLA